MVDNNRESNHNTFYYHCMVCQNVFENKQEGRYVGQLNQPQAREMNLLREKGLAEVTSGFCGPACCGSYFLGFHPAVCNIEEIISMLQESYSGEIPPANNHRVLTLDGHMNTAKSYGRLVQRSLNGTPHKGFMTGKEGIKNLYAEGDASLIFVGELEDITHFAFEYVAGGGNGRIVPVDNFYFGSSLINLLFRDQAINSVNLPDKGRVRITRNLDTETVGEILRVSGIMPKKS